MLTRFAPVFALLLALALPAPPARAESGLGDLVRIDVLDGGMTARGTYMTALRLTLADGWKTYWRAPGDAGIPPSFDWRGSQNVGAVSITWPAPGVFETGGFRTIGYERQLVLPVEITPARADAPVRLKGRMDLGICADVCVPGTLRFDHRPAADAARHPAIAAAMAARPYSASEAGVRAATCTIRPTADGMAVSARITMPPAGGEELAVIEPGDPTLWAAETTATRQGDTLVARTELMAADGGAFALDRSRLRITVLGQRHSVDIRGCTPG